MWKKQSMPKKFDVDVDVFNFKRRVEEASSVSAGPETLAWARHASGVILAWIQIHMLQSCRTEKHHLEGDSIQMVELQQ